jgi:toxin ParE1/3/4
VSELIVSAAAESELDDIWLFVARASQSIEIASRVVDGITARFGMLARHPAMGRAREDLGPGLRSFAAEGYLIVYDYQEPSSVRVLHVVARGRDPGSLHLQ